MALQVVNLTDTFDQWRVKTNTIGAGIVYDDSPQLGGNLDLNNNNITGTGNLNITGTLTATSFTGNILGSGSIAGTVTGTTQSPSDNSTKLATTAYVDAQVATEDTLAEMNDTTLSSLANLDILQYNSGTSVWENKTLAAAGVPTKGFTVAMAVALG
tara:strand:+ start:183 stop:653 length:471 start_codon:yes stop_codon:yes gene_type:complete